MSEERTLLLSWGRRYAGVAVAVAIAALVVSLLPSRVPDRVADAAAPSLTSQPVLPPASTAPPADAGVVPGRLIRAVPTIEPREIGPGEPPPVDPGPDAPPPPSECPLALPPSDPPPQGAPFLIQFLPLVGPFGPEALAFFPFLGAFLPIVTPFFLYAAPLEDVALITDAVNGAILVQRTVFGPLEPTIETYHPQALEYENQLMSLLLLPVADAAQPAVVCTYLLNSLVAGMLPAP